MSDRKQPASPRPGRTEIEKRGGHSPQKPVSIQNLKPPRNTTPKPAKDN